MIDKEVLQKAIGKRIKQLREKKNITQVELAHLCDFDKPNMNRLEAGNTNPTLYTLLKIATNLDVSLTELVELELNSSN